MISGHRETTGTAPGITAVATLPWTSKLWSPPWTHPALTHVISQPVSSSKSWLEHMNTIPFQVHQPRSVDDSRARPNDIAAGPSSSTDNTNNIENRHEYQIETHLTRIPVAQQATLSHSYCRINAHDFDYVCKLSKKRSYVESFQTNPINKQRIMCFQLVTTQSMNMLKNN